MSDPTARPGDNVAPGLQAEDLKVTPADLRLVDGDGRAWQPRLDCLALMEFERLTGVGLFASLFKAVRDSVGLDDGEGPPKIDLDPKVLFELASQVFGSVENCVFLVWAGCQRPEQHPGVSKEQLAATLRKKELTACLRVSLMALLDVFPGPDEEEGGSDDNRPFDPGPGATSSS